MKKSIDHPLGVKPHMKSLGARKHEGTKARYNQLEKDIRSTLKSIDGQLKDHKKRFLSNPWSYGYSDDLSYVLGELIAIKDSMNNS